MFLKGNRASFIEETYTPPVGYYDVPLKSKSRMVDFGSKPKNQSRLQHLTQEIELPPRTLPNISATNRQLHAYANPKDRVEFNKKYKVKYQKQARDEEEDYDGPPNFYSYDPNYSIIKPRVKGGVLQPPPQINDTQPIFEYVDMGEILTGQRIETKQNNKSMITPEQELSLSLYKGDQSTQMNSELVDLREQLKDRLKSQKRYKHTQKRLNFDDNLEQLLLRVKMRNDQQQPGPGEYYDPAIWSSMKVTSVPARYQFFNSQVRRFTLDEAQKLGPGYYNADQKSPIPLGSFAKSIKKKEVSQHNSPSVGQYNTSFQHKIKRNNNVEYPSAFGSGLKRF